MGPVGCGLGPGERGVGVGGVLCDANEDRRKIKKGREMRGGEGRGQGRGEGRGKGS